MSSLFWTVMYKIQLWYIISLHKMVIFLMQLIVTFTGKSLTMECLIEESEEEDNQLAIEGNGNVGALIRITPKSDLNYDVKGVILEEDDYLVKVKLNNGNTSIYHFGNLEILEDA